MQVLKSPRLSASLDITRGPCTRRVSPSVALPVASEEAPAGAGQLAAAFDGEEALSRLDGGGEAQSQGEDEGLELHRMDMAVFSDGDLFGVSQGLLACSILSGGRLLARVKADEGNI